MISQSIGRLLGKMLGFYILPQKAGGHISEKTTYRPCVNSFYRVREKSPYRDTEKTIYSVREKTVYRTPVKTSYSLHPCRPRQDNIGGFDVQTKRHVCRT
jgi:hypothetical protein